ncbi:MAG: hypothetical protein K2X27_19430 [Candidatus Obscuribacterales bacterium]|nr:hypothetical protein [Candidatus Obscuribacterales bacterium]
MGFLKSPTAGKHSVCILLSLCFFGLIPAEAKRLAFQLPASDKMSDDETPQSAASSEKKAQNLNLAPVGLHDDEAKESTAEEASDPSLLKSTVSQTDFMAKSKAGSNEKNAVASGKKESVIDKNKLGDKVLGKGKAIDVRPLALQVSDEEASQKAELTLTAEQRQLTDLWQSAIERNPDIQFVMQKLQPTTDANHAMASTMKFLNATLCGAMNMAPFMLPGGISQANPMAMMGMSSGAGLIQGLFQDKAAKGAKKQAISQEQATILYKIVRETADKLVTSYREYKKEQTGVERATADLQDLQAMAAESKPDQSKALEMEYTLRKAKRDIDEKLEQVKVCKQQLLDLAGAEAVAKLDQQLVAERNAVNDLTGGSSTALGAEQQKQELAQPGPDSGPIKNPLNQMKLAAPNSGPF